MKKSLTFALCFGNRFVFSPVYIKDARKEVAEAVERAGHKYLIPDESMTPFGAVETMDQARVYAKWLKSHEGEYDGVIFSMPNFSDENGAAVALREAGVPILIQAYPDDLDKLSTSQRRDSFCGKFSVQDVLNQYQIPYTIYAPHCVHPLSEEFQQNLRDFAAVCRVVNGMRHFTVGAFGARTTRFKTIRYDEMALEKYGITVETIDLAEMFDKIRALKDDDQAVTQKRKVLTDYVNCSAIKPESVVKLAKLSVVIDWYIETYNMQAFAFRCWPELGDQLGISVCPLMSYYNNIGIPASCEVDICTAISMYAIQLASEEPTMCLDWNNNYGDEKDKCIIFHCGPVPKALMKPGEACVVPNQLNNLSEGCYVGDIDSFAMTYSGCKTENGVLSFYVDEGEMTDDPIDSTFFGAKGVAHIPNLPNKLLVMGRNSFRHHLAVGRGRVAAAIREAFTYYLHYDIVDLDQKI